MTLSITRSALTVGAFLAITAPASAGSYDSIKMRIPDIPVAPGVIEHTTTESCWTYSGRLEGFSPDGCAITDVYSASDRGREISRTPEGAVIGESATVGGTIFSWSAKDDELVVGRGRAGRPSSLSFAAEAGMWQDTIARGWYAPVGESVRDGRTVVTYQETSAAPPVAGEAFLVLDKASGAVVERSFDQPDNDGRQRVLARETLPLNATTAKLLDFGDHAGAKVREVQGEEATIARAARRAGLKAKARAKIRTTLRKKARRS